jgi:hypothetical protein
LTKQAQRFHWVDPDADYLALRPWLRPAIAAALDALDAARPDAMTWGLLHTDPSRERDRWLGPLEDAARASPRADRRRLAERPAAVRNCRNGRNS